MADTLQLPVQVKEGTQSPENPHKSSSIVTHTAAACLALSLCVGGEDVRAENTSPITSNNNTIVLAQANIEDGRTGPYPVMIPQVNGGSKMIEYFRDSKGAIMAPPVKDGKLVDGSDAPENPVEARVAQKKILVKYDKGALLALAMVGPKDLISDAFKNIDIVASLAEQGKPISKEQIQNSLFGQYIILLSGGKVDGMMKLTDTIATTQLKLNNTEIARMKKEAESKAISIWKSVTGAMGIG